MFSPGQGKRYFQIFKVFLWLINILNPVLGCGFFCCILVGSSSALLPFCSSGSNPCPLPPPVSEMTRGYKYSQKAKRGVVDKEKNSSWLADQVFAGGTLSDLDLQKQLPLHPLWRHTVVRPRPGRRLTPPPTHSPKKEISKRNKVRIFFFEMPWGPWEWQNASPSLDIPSWESGVGLSMAVHFNEHH